MKESIAYGMGSSSSPWGGSKGVGVKDLSGIPHKGCEMRVLRVLKVLQRKKSQESMRIRRKSNNKSPNRCEERARSEYMAPTSTEGVKGDIIRHSSDKKRGGSRN